MVDAWTLDWLEITILKTVKEVIGLVELIAMKYLSLGKKKNLRPGKILLSGNSSVKLG